MPRRLQCTFNVREVGVEVLIIALIRIHLFSRDDFEDDYIYEIVLIRRNVMIDHRIVFVLFRFDQFGQFNLTFPLLSFHRDQTRIQNRT